MKTIMILQVIHDTVENDPKDGTILLFVLAFFIILSLINRVPEDKNLE